MLFLRLDFFFYFWELFYPRSYCLQVYYFFFFANDGYEYSYVDDLYIQIYTFFFSGFYLFIYLFIYLSLLLLILIYMCAVYYYFLAVVSFQHINHSFSDVAVHLISFHLFSLLTYYHLPFLSVWCPKYSNFGLTVQIYITQFLFFFFFPFFKSSVPFFFL
ncbi:uncharacterized protein SCDLUD_000081 [Saccharomycodes ludwigii]|uniref:uncharacterized protein n=1 Tax=Saccharomycodes ludwigii TaxID=36035 RepID=UPI001E88588D|nr:hypothetical protein SCDLUD_000081 [Saccharomycodes ludwigii]KAH3902504.1 hypothetical protein SCDLUD_000081 [Saccharomycodes ludwigii]